MTRPYESANVAGRYQILFLVAVIVILLILNRDRSTNMKNYGSLTESRMLSALLVGRTK